MCIGNKHFDNVGERLQVLLQTRANENECYCDNTRFDSRQVLLQMRSNDSKQCTCNTKIRFEDVVKRLFSPFSEAEGVALNGSSGCQNFLLG